MWVIKNDNLATEVNAQLFKRFHHCPCQTTGIECIVVFDVWTFEHETNTAVWQVQTNCHFRVTLVCAVAHTEPSTYL